jgi:hypothetical protein
LAKTEFFIKQKNQNMESLANVLDRYKIFGKNLFSTHLAFAPIVLLVVTFACQQESPTNSVIELPEVAAIDVVKYEPFRASVEKFAGSISPEQYQFLSSYVLQNSDKKSSASNKSALKVTCTCSVGQATCEAIASTSECCICCGAGQSAACGVYFGIASCECSGSTPKGGKAPQDLQASGTVTVYPRDIERLLQFAEKNNFDIREVRWEFDQLFLQ